MSSKTPQEWFEDWGKKYKKYPVEDYALSETYTQNNNIWTYIFGPKQQKLISSPTNIRNIAGPVSNPQVQCLMAISINGFPNCCGMNILHGFVCSSVFSAKDYWNFIQLILSKDYNPSLAIISNADGYEKTIPNQAISKYATFLQKTRNGNYGSCISTYMVFPQQHGDYFIKDLDNKAEPIRSVW